jgi:hypothetical protein
MFLSRGAYVLQGSVMVAEILGVCGVPVIN